MKNLVRSMAHMSPLMSQRCSLLSSLSSKIACGSTKTSSISSRGCAFPQVAQITVSAISGVVS
jgi:hypothetical protein